MKKQYKEILKRFKEMGSEVKQHYEKDGRLVVCTETTLLSYEEKSNEITLLFNCALNPTLAATIALEMDSIEGISFTNIGELFMYVNEDDSGVVIGEAATKLFHKQLQQLYIKDFSEQHHQIKSLIDLDIENMKEQ